MKSEVIDMDPFWQDELKEFPQFTRNKGRMLNLLKEKSKVGFKPKDRKKYRPYLPEDQDSSLIDIKAPQISSQQKPGNKSKIVPTVLEVFKKDEDQNMGK